MSIALATRGIIGGVVGSGGSGGPCLYDPRLTTIEEAIDDLFVFLDAYVPKRDWKIQNLVVEDEVDSLETTMLSLEAQLENLRGIVNNI